MEYIETTLGRLAKYTEHLEKWTRDILEESLETEEYCKTYSRYRKTIEIIANHFYPNTSKRKFFEENLNELYTSLRKVNYMLTEFEKNSIFSRERNKKYLKQCLERNQYIINEYLSIMKKFDNKFKNKIPKDFKPDKITKNETSFYLSIKNQKYTPLSCENIFVNMTQYKDMVYYVETNDVFSFFYFYRTEDAWYWSPPKKTDPEDIWIECPQVKIEEGYWDGKIIPPYMAEFIVWLDLFFPNIPEFYLDKEQKEKKETEKDNEKKNKKKGKKSEKKSEKNSEKKSQKNKGSKTNKGSRKK